MPLAPFVDAGTRAIWRVLGREIDLDGAERWLRGPTSPAGPVGASWLANAAEAAGGRLDESPGGGLVADMAQLDGPGFRAADLVHEVRDFYENTSQWRMEVWTQWTPVFQPAGELISRLFGRRVQQLALPTRPLDLAPGMDSQVVRILDAGATQVAAGWLRTLRATGDHVYSGCYSIRQLPGARRPSVHVTFPLEAGNVQVFLRPDVLPDGSLTLNSPSGGFGHDGCYVVVDEGRAHAARVPIHETFRVYTDQEGTLRTDHELRLWAATVVRLHYKLTRARP